MLAVVMRPPLRSKNAVQPRAPRVQVSVLIFGRERRVLSSTQSSAVPDACCAIWLAVGSVCLFDEDNCVHRQLQHPHKVP